ncbi:hypothetical protein AgCh_009927 [Apium graveolens]
MTINDEKLQERLMKFFEGLGQPSKRDITTTIVKKVCDGRYDGDATTTATTVAIVEYDNKEQVLIKTRVIHWPPGAGLRDWGGSLNERTTVEDYLVDLDLDFQQDLTLVHAKEDN